MKKTVFLFISPILLLQFYLFTPTVFAACENFCGSDPRIITLKIIQIVFAGLLLILFFIIAYAGYKLITGREDKKRIKTAKKLIFYTIIGLIVVLLAYEISIFFLNGFVSATSY